MKVHPVCEQSARNLLYIIVGFVISFVFILFLLIFGLPLILCRLSVKVLGRLLRPDLICMMAPSSSMFAVDPMTSKPRNNILIWMVVEGEMGVNMFRGAVKERLIDLKRGNQLAYPELQQFFQSWLGYSFWSWEKCFSLHQHVREVSYKDCGLASPQFTKSQFLDIVPEYTTRPWGEGESPWEFLILYNYIGEDEEKEIKPKTLVMFRFHHAIGDGYSVLKMLLYNLANLKGAKVAKPNYVKRGILESLLHQALLPLRIPFEFARQLIEAKDQNDWVLPFKKLSPLPYSVEVDGIPMKKIKEIKNAHKVTFMAVLIAAISGAIRKTLIKENKRVPIKMKACNPVPITGHPMSQLVNHLSYIGIKFPIGTANGRERMLISQKDLDSLKMSTLPITNFWLTRIFGSTPVWIIAFVRQSLITTTLISSNFPGPEEEDQLLGHKVLALSGTNGLYYGTPAVTLLMLSYGGFMRINVNINKSIISSKSGALDLSRRIRDEFDLLLGEEIV